jgi:hypothetical protein
MTGVEFERLLVPRHNAHSARKSLNQPYTIHRDGEAYPDNCCCPENVQTPQCVAEKSVAQCAGNPPPNAQIMEGEDVKGCLGYKGNRVIVYAMYRFRQREMRIE